MNKLDAAAILKVLREERERQLENLYQELPAPALTEDLDVEVKVDGAKKKVVAPGLKLRSKQGGRLFTVKAVGPDSAILTDPSGQDVNVTDKELENGFDLD